MIVGQGFVDRHSVDLQVEGEPDLDRTGGYGPIVPQEVRLIYRRSTGAPDWELSSCVVYGLPRLRGGGVGDNRTNVIIRHVAGLVPDREPPEWLQRYIDDRRPTL